MAIIGIMDLGIGDYSTEAYVRIVRVTYNPEVISYNTDGTTYTTPEIEIEFANYHNKACRQLEILRDYVKDFLNNNTIPDDKKLWLQNNILSRYARPLQQLIWATKDFSMFKNIDLPSVPETVYVPYFYGWVKTHTVMGTIINVQDDMSVTADTIAQFRKEHPDIFGA
jgi:hypothetical protein